ncbi:TIGR01777 family oxidoreductase [Antiquaquibacter soli]|uniref:TIGR01777 family oxidoreductase n=1 Tax=Antiquaquibacter soli TaxID=3064523 RepID=A0ABT9BL08_9MICO|nr:TIGR01777 family oxidoreductase [Protaetiibacter sp. WY-16]MDO7881700.1 TIGR01777 family oxidoreductase [Protaetiibacter sp. WY-16]
MPAARAERILVSGASGFIGTELCRQLEADGRTVLRLVRREPASPDEFRWSPDEGTIDPRALEAADAVVNLSGASTGRLPWTASYKREILYSRVNATRTLAEAIGRASDPPRVLVNGSAVGYYGDRPGETLDENSAKGDGFLSDVVQAWEQAAALVPDSTRVVLARTGVVVGRGGAFTPLVPLTLVGLGARFGRGTQVWPWISLHDEAAALRHLIDSELDGVVALAGPEPATSAEITTALAETLRRWHPWVIPTFAIKLLGDAGQELLLNDQHVVPERLLADGFEFRDSTAAEAISRAFAPDGGR